MNIKRLLVLFLFIIHLFTLHSQAVYPACPDFCDITAPHVTAAYGTVSNPSFIPGLLPNRHAVISTQALDPNTGNLLPMLPPGKSCVVKLGNDNVGAEAESLTYRFLVDSANPILSINFAVVFQDPQHQFDEQPRFRVRVTDTSGQLVGTCAEYDVTADQSVPGFHTYGNAYDPTLWCDWTNLIMDMSNRVGEEVQVQFTTYDCALGAHFGYAYFTAECTSNTLQIEGCAGNQFTVVAPDNFASYLWDNGDTTPSSTRTLTGDSAYISCYVTNPMGCSYTLNAYASATPPGAVQAIVFDTICEGEAYTANNFNLLSNNESGEFIYTNSLFNIATCATETSTLHLKVVKKYYNINASICQGENYELNGFSIIAPSTGVLLDTLSFTTPSNCDSIVCLKLTVNESFNMPKEIVGELRPCKGELLEYTFTGGQANYTWIAPPNAIIVEGQGTTTAKIVFKSVVSSEIILIGENGCGKDSFSLMLEPRPSYRNVIRDTICAKETYNQYNFNLGVQDSTGKFTFIHADNTTLGCDSTTVLHLSVLPKPSLSIEVVGDSVICLGDSVILRANGILPTTSYTPVPDIAIGDILCTDDSTVKPADYATSGKTALGVVFYVDRTGQHGWAMSLSDIDTNIVWSSAYVDIPTMTNYATYREAMSDIDGYGNTQKMRAAGTATDYPLAYVADFAAGWYIPSLGQICIMYANTLYIEPTLQMLGGDLNYMVYPSSTEMSDENFWYIWAYYAPKDLGVGYVRTVRSF